MAKFFAYDPEDGFHIFDTPEEAQAHAQTNIDCCLECAADDGWPDSVDSICWGEIKQKSTQTDLRPAEEESHFDYICGYELKEPE